MDRDTFLGLSIARIYRSGELLEEAKRLLEGGKYKSANNRAFYSIEKAALALLAVKEINVDSHRGCLKQLNIHFIRPEEGEFRVGDYKKIASVERIRNTSDYDDFYLADKEECRFAVDSAIELYKKTLDYLEHFEGFSNHINNLKAYL